MSSSGLIYAMIVGAWAAYLVPMWLRRQDELNEARPTERFSTAIRLLSGRAGMERRYARELAKRDPGTGGDTDGPACGEPEAGAVGPDAVTDMLDARAFAVPATVSLEGLDGLRATDRTGPAADRWPTTGSAVPGRRPAPRTGGRCPSSAAERARRSKVLARRRRTTMVLFLAFTLGAVAAAVGGLALLWAPAVPAVLLSSYIAHLRSQERRRFTFTMDQRRAEVAAQRLREYGPRPRRPQATGGGLRAPAGTQPGPAPAPEPGPAPVSPHTAGRRALVEQTDHAEWVDQQRERQQGGSEGDSWEPVPVPLPTYVTAPVAPRATGSVDLEAPDAWNSARSSTVKSAAGPAPRDLGSRTPRSAAGRRARERGRTPLFDQYAHPPAASRQADPERPRAANE